MLVPRVPLEELHKKTCSWPKTLPFSWSGVSGAGLDWLGSLGAELQKLEQSGHKQAQSRTSSSSSFPFCKSEVVNML